MKRVILFAGALYDSPLWTNRQHVASRLAARGWQVLYVEPRLYVPRMMVQGVPGTRGRFAWLRRARFPWRAGERVWVVSQFNVLPGSRAVRFISRVNHALNRMFIMRFVRRLGFSDAAVLLYDTEAAQYLSGFPRARIVYDCVDDHAAQEGVSRHAARVHAEERAIAKRADAIAVTTESLEKKFSGQNARVRRVPNAADVDAFLAPQSAEPEDMRAIPHPRIGTVGALDAYKVDIAMLLKTAVTHPDWHFVLVGPSHVVSTSDEGHGERLATLSALPNMHLLGPRPHGDVPAYVHAFDVAMIPYRESAYNASSFPLKFWEFMASGKPIVASGLPSLAPYARFAHLAPHPESFVDAVEAALRESAESSLSRREESKKHSWDSRVDAIEALLLGRP